MKEHPINEILRTSLQNINILVDVNKVIGEPILLPDNIIAIPVSKVICGYGVGGSEFKVNSKEKTNSEISKDLFPFGGATGGGLTMLPQALIIIKDNKIQLMNIDKDNEMLPKILEIFKDMIKK